MKEYVFYNKQLKEIFDSLCTEEIDNLQKMCIDLDKRLSPYKVKPVYNKGVYYITKDGEPLDEYGYFAKSLDEIKTYQLSEAIDFIDWLKTY